MASLTPIDTTRFNDQPQSMLCSVPKEVLLSNIFSRLTISEISNLKLTCKSLSVLTDHPLLFKHLLIRDFQKTEEESRCKSIYQHFHKVHQNILKGNYHLKEIKELANIYCFKIEGDRLIGSIGHTLKIWDFNSYECLLSLKGHEGNICCIEVQDGKIYTGSIDHVCRIWDLKTGKCLGIFRGHTNSILHLKIIEKKLITACIDQTCKIWDIETYKCLNTLGVNDYSITRFDAAKDKVIGFSSKFGISIWSIESGKCLHSFKEKRIITSIKLIDNEFITVDNYTCQMRDLETGKINEDFPSELSGINCLEIIDDLVIFGGQGQWRSWNRKTGEIVTSEMAFAHTIGTIRVSQGKVFTGCYWSTVAKIWDLKTGKCLQTLQIPNFEVFANGICCLEIKEGKLIVSNKTSCCIWDFIPD